MDMDPFVMQPTVYGKGASPMILLSIVYILVSLLLTCEIYFELKYRPPFSSRLKRISIYSFLLQNVWVACVTMVPFPYNHVAAEVLTTTIPTLINFCGLISFSIWVIITLTAPHLRPSKRVKILVVIYLLVVIVLHVADIITNFLGRYVVRLSSDTKLHTVSQLLSAVSYVLVGVVLCIAGFRLLRIVRLRVYLHVVRWKVNLIVVVSQLLALICVAQFFYKLFDAIHLNVIETTMENSAKTCGESDPKTGETWKKSCHSFHWIFFGWYFSFDCVSDILIACAFIPFTITRILKVEEDEDEAETIIPSTDPRHRALMPGGTDSVNSLSDSFFSVNDDSTIDEKLLFSTGGAKKGGMWEGLHGEVLGRGEGEKSGKRKILFRSSKLAQGSDREMIVPLL
ncbi:hypothetical protein BLNAU_7716 [Blattamonas nauphoetae]|uniref:Uncharacterized protein n=1 Tax=Blattamonas nauphoetae TaxID=2049346 RepID=A0ABQ9Y0U6_9EUKA|nr:hypothetical protein BLNAU_7716 [Blattamonas nauphoetae]